MHIPDGFLDAKTWAGAWVISGGILGYGAMKTKEVLDERQVPTLGVMAAFIFAAQMVNFPVATGTSGHLLGAALATILLGPWSAGLILATVLTIQCLLFQDGGFTVLGANMLNMAVIAPIFAYFTYRIVTKLIAGNKGQKIGTFLAAWISVMIAALAAAAELWLSGTVPMKLVFPAMIGWHILIGIGEGIITTVVVSFVTSMGYGQMNQSSKEVSN